MKKRYFITLLFLMFFNINQLKAEEIYIFDKENYSEEEFEEIFTNGCDGINGTFCNASCLNGTEFESISLENNSCGSIYDIKKFKIGDGSKKITQKELGEEIFNKYFSKNDINKGEIDKTKEESKSSTGTLYFEQNHFETDKFGDFVFNICNNGTSCFGSCANNSSGADKSFNIDSIPCGGTEGIEKFRIGDGDINKTIQTLQNTSCGNSENCWEYISNNYCKGYTGLDKNDSRYNLCDKLNNFEEETGTCSYTFKNMDETKKIAINGTLTTDKKDLILNVNDNSFFTNGGTFDGQILSGYNNKLHFYAKNQDYNSFKSEYIKRYNENNKCPELCFGYDINDVWYTAFDQTEFEDSKYKIGYVNCSSNGKTTLKGVAGDVSLILGENITFENCKELFEDSPELLEMLKFVINIIKIGIPIILIGLGILDMSKSIFASKEDEMKKAQTKFIQRLIIGVCIFIAPIILKLILTIGNSIWGNISPDFCGIL